MMLSTLDNTTMTSGIHRPRFVRAPTSSRQRLVDDLELDGMRIDHDRPL